MNTVKINSGKTKIIAHRGLSGIECENTCPAFVAAGNRSYFGIESDVHVSKDGEFIIIHDETIKRVSEGKYDINVEESSYKDIENIILPDIDGTTTRKDIKIPLLAEYISICKKYEKKAVLEVKKHFKVSDLERLIKEIKEMNYIENVIFISFDLENCINIRNFLPQNTVQWLIGKSEEITKDLIQTLCKHNLDLDIHYKSLTKENIELLHLKDIKVNCWTCDDKDYAEKLVLWGVDYITTNILE